MSIILAAEHISLEYKTRTSFLKSFSHKAIDDVSFSINRGEIFGVLGRNGSGKSSLLQLLAGIFQPDQGRIIVSKDVSRSLLTLGLGFNPMLTGRDNTILSCMLNGFSRKKSQGYLKEIKAFSELGDFFEQPVRTYSAGMWSRLGFSTAILTEVDILLIDEVLSVGDKAFKEKAESALMDKLHGKQTVIFVSHDETQVKKICDRAIWLERGKLKMSGNISEVVSSYVKPCSMSGWC